MTPARSGVCVLRRATEETDVRVALGVDATSVDTGDPFLDHMLVVLALYAGVRLQLRARGDLPHHLAEDVALTLGRALRETVPAACRRFGECTLPMDEVLVQVALDLGGRFYYAGDLPDPAYQHFLRSLAQAAGWTLHLRVLRDGDRHHLIEATMKALGRALAQAMHEADALLSSKGPVRWSRGKP